MRLRTQKHAHGYRTECETKRSYRPQCVTLTFTAYQNEKVIAVRRTELRNVKTVGEMLDRRAKAWDDFCSLTIDPLQNLQEEY